MMAASTPTVRRHPYWAIGPIVALCIVALSGFALLWLASAAVPKAAAAPRPAVIYTRESGKPEHGTAYQVVQTAGLRLAPGSRGLAPELASVLADTPGGRLVVFKVVVSIEFEPTEAYLEDLKAGLRAASRFLYEVTQGQMIFGEITIGTNGALWDAADIRVLAANDLRPMTYVGGIVPQPTNYAWNNLTFLPAVIFLPRHWDGNGAGSGAWAGVPGYTTIAHEWAHYALFLYDEYRQADGEATYCTDDALPGVDRLNETASSIMAYPYTTWALWHPGDPAVPPFSDHPCWETEQATLHSGHGSDWETLAIWYELQGIDGGGEPPDAGLVIPELDAERPNAALAEDLVTSVTTIGEDDAAVPSPVLRLRSSSDMPAVDLAGALIMVWLELPGPGSGRLIYQGTTQMRLPRDGLRDLGDISLVGVPAGEPALSSAKIHVAVVAGAGGAPVYQWQGLGAADWAGESVLSVALNAGAWQPDIEIGFGVMGNLAISLASDVALATPPRVEIGADGVTESCAASVCSLEMMLVDGRWGASWPPAGAPELGLNLPLRFTLRIVAEGIGQVILPIQRAGGIGPAHLDVKAPLRDSPVVVDVPGVPTKRNGPPLNGCSQAYFMPAVDRLRSGTTGQPPRAPLPPGVKGRLGPAVDVDLVCRLQLHDPSGAPIAPPGTSISLFYSQATMDRLRKLGLPVDESKLVVLHFSRASGRWTVSAARPLANPSGNPPRPLGTALNFITAEFHEEGIYAVGWR